MRTAPREFLSLENQKGAGVSASPPVSHIRSLAHPGDGRAAAAAGSVPLTGKGRGNPRSNGRLGVRWPVTGTGRLRRARDPASMSLRCRCASRRSGIAIRSSTRHDPEGTYRSMASRRCSCPKASCTIAAMAALSWPCPKAPPLRCNPLHPVRRRALRPWPLIRPRCPKTPVASRPPVTPDAGPKDAIGRLSVPFPQRRCEHRRRGFPGWRPRLDPHGFPKAPAWLKP
jgi:hypothetical protein